MAMAGAVRPGALTGVELAKAVRSHVSPFSARGCRTERVFDGPLETNVAVGVPYGLEPEWYVARAGYAVVDGVAVSSVLWRVPPGGALRLLSLETLTPGYMVTVSPVDLPVGILTSSVVRSVFTPASPVAVDLYNFSGTEFAINCGDGLCRLHFHLV
jgi:hypothetical protein